MKAWISVSLRARPSRLWRMTSMGWMVWFIGLFFENEGGWKEIGNAGFVDAAVLSGEEDQSVRCTELKDGLSAGSAGRAGSIIEVRDDDGANADGRTVECNGSGDGVLLGAGGEAVRSIFNVAAGDDGVTFEKNSGSYVEVAVRGIGVLGGGDGALLQIRNSGWAEVAGRVCCRHVSEAIGCVEGWQVGVAHGLARTSDKRDVDDLTKEFIAESQEGLDRMERCLTELEIRPDDRELVGEI